MRRIGWRIVPEGPRARAFDGEGARLHGGRWNSVGTAVVYASEHLSLAALEVLVHIDTTSRRKAYQCLSFEFDDSLLKTFADLLPRTWRQEPPPVELQQIGDAWVRGAESVVLAVPSVIVPGEFNYLLNPRHPDFGRIKPGSPARFDFDSRLF